MALTKPRAIIFDWDNTLVDTWPVIHAALNATFEATGKPLWTFDMTRDRVRKSMRDSFPEIFGEQWEEAAKMYQANYRASHLSALVPLPEAEALLKAIKKRGIYCVVVSNKKGDNLRKEISHLGWDVYFDKIVGADDAKRDKPFTDPVELAFSETHIKPGSDVWFIGDSDIDLECAENAGCMAILYGTVAKEHKNWTPTHFHGKAYHHFVHDHDEMLKLFERFTQ